MNKVVPRVLTRTDRAAYERDGVVLLEGVF